MLSSLNLTLTLQSVVTFLMTVGAFFWGVEFVVSALAPAVFASCAASTASADSTLTDCASTLWNNGKMCAAQNPDGTFQLDPFGNADALQVIDPVYFQPAVYAVVGVAGIVFLLIAYPFCAFGAGWALFRTRPTALSLCTTFYQLVLILVRLGAVNHLFNAVLVSFFTESSSSPCGADQYVALAAGVSQSPSFGFLSEAATLTIQYIVGAALVVSVTIQLTSPMFVVFVSGYDAPLPPPQPAPVVQMVPVAPCTSCG